MTQAMRAIGGNTCAPGQYGMADDDPRRLVGHDISTNQITAKQDGSESSPDRDDTAEDDPRRLVGHDVPYNSL
jgi:hypothetical protein